MNDGEGYPTESMFLCKCTCSTQKLAYQIVPLLSCLIESIVNIIVQIVQLETPLFLTCV